MSETKANSRRAMKFPLLALLFVSVVSVGLVALRIEWTKSWRYSSLVWNLFLAWLPLLFALGAYQRRQAGARRGWRLYLFAAMWLLFFPNAPYIFTDLIHLSPWFLPQFWMDFSLILMMAFTGFVLGFLSLYLMQSLVAEQFGWKTSWAFVLGVACLSGFGIYLGRILRWNSWDVLLHPVRVSNQVGHMAAHPVAHSSSVAISAVFATFLFLGYLMLYALTHLQTAQTPRVAA